MDVEWMLRIKLPNVENFRLDVDDERFFGWEQCC